MLTVKANKCFIVLECVLPVLSIYIAYTGSCTWSYLRETHMKWRVLLYTILVLTILLLLRLLLIFNSLSADYIVLRTIVSVFNVRHALG